MAISVSNEDLENRMEALERKLEESKQEIKDYIQESMNALKLWIEENVIGVPTTEKEELRSCEEPRKVIDRIPVPFPYFDGSNFKEWKAKCELFFEMENTPEAQRGKLLLMAMEGKAFFWQRHYRRTIGRQKLSWKQILEDIAGRFDTSSYENPFSELFRLNQAESLEEYMDSFDELWARAGVDGKMALSLFLGGLKPPLEKAVRMHNPGTVHEAMKLARMQEDILLELCKQPHMVQRSYNNCQPRPFWPNTTGPLARLPVTQQKFSPVAYNADDVDR